LRRPSLFASAGLLAIVVAGCGARPQQAVGVSAGPTVHYLLCGSDRVTSVRLTTPPGRTLWRIDSSKGSTRTTYRAGSTPPGFRTVVPFRGLAPQVRVSGPTGKPVMQLSRVPAGGILRADGVHVTAAEFAKSRSGYCTGVRQARGVAFALTFVLVVLALVFAGRWLRSRRVRDPYRRAWSVHWKHGRDRPGP
jgi:hypothetical protein